MATNDIGRVTPIWRGFFSAATTYELNDIVIDTDGSVWWHKSPAQTTGVIPEAGEIWDAVIDMSVFSGLIQAAITTAQTALEAAREAVGEVSADTERAETAAQNAETSALNAAESAASVGAQAQAAERSAEAAAGSATGAAGSAEAAAGSKSDAEAYAVGKRGGEDVETTDPTFHNNAKYYSEQAETSADAAAQSAEDAQNVLDSIPADYSTLSADVGDLKESLTNAENAIITGSDAYIPLTWHTGNLNTSSGAEESGTRQRSDYFSIEQNSFTVSFASPITDCMVFWYDDEYTYKTRTGWLSNGATTAKANKYFRIMARKSGSSQLTDTEIKSFKAVTNPIWEDTDKELDARLDLVEPVLSAFTVGDELLTIDGKFINTNGNEQTYTTTESIHYYATDFIDISYCSDVVIKTCLGTGSTISVYNGAKVKTQTITTKGSSAVYNYLITINSGDTYIRASFQELTNYTTKDQFTFTAYKNIIQSLDALGNNVVSNNADERAQLKPLVSPTVVFVDDDGSSSLWDTTVPIFETAGIPLTIAVGKDSDIMSDLSTLRTWLSTAGHDMVQHSLGSDQDLSAKTYAELIAWIESEQAFFYNNGFVVSNIVYGGSQWSDQMIRVIERYYNCGCTIPNSQMGIRYGYNLPGTSRYKLSRYAVSNWTSTSGHSLQNCKDIFDEFLATGQNGIIIFYSHSYQLVDNPDRVQILTDFIDYVKAAQTRGECTISTLSAVFG